MARLIIVGAGVVGRATGNGFAARGHDVAFVDPDPIARRALLEAGRESVALDALDLAGADVVFLCVPTPEGEGDAPYEPLDAAVKAIARGLARAPQRVVVAVRSTVLPGTTEGRVLAGLERGSGRRVGPDVGLVANPEFLRAASAEADFERPWVTVIGATDPRDGDVVAALFAPFAGAVVRCSPREAEAIKIAANGYNAVKISYFNEIHRICEAVGADPSVVGEGVARAAEGMWNPRYGIRGGAPFGGACLPKDVANWRAHLESVGLGHLLIEAALDVNAGFAARPAAAVLAR